MEYLLKFILASAILYGIYYLFLKQERTFHFNRFYLLLIIPIALLVPKLTVKTRYLEVPSAYPQQVLQFSQPIINNSMVDFPEQAATVPTTETVSSTPFDWLTLIITLFILVSTVLLVRLVINLYRLSAFRNSGEVIKNGEYTLCLRDDIASSFTFLNTIFTNKSEYKAGKLPQDILTHEAIHAGQKHSIDIIVMEVLNVLLWFNPVLYLIKQSIKLNHEFLADNGVYTQNNSIPQYQQTLLHYAKINSNNEPVLASRLTYGETKKRLKIMVKSTNKHITRAKVTLALVAIATTTFLLGKERMVAQDSTEELYKIWEEQNSFKYVERADSVELLMVGPFPEPEELVRLTNTDGSVTEKQLNELSSTERAWLADVQSKAQFLGSKNNQWTAIGAIDRMKRWDASKPADRSLLDISRKMSREAYNLIDQDSTYRFIFSNNVVIRFKDSEGIVLEKPHNKLTKEEKKWLLDESAEAKVIFPKREANPPSAKQLEGFKNSNKYGVWVDGKRIENTELDNFNTTDFHHFDQSKLLPNAKNYGKHTFQINLITWEKFNETIDNEDWVWYKDALSKRVQKNKKTPPNDTQPSTSNLGKIAPPQNGQHEMVIPTNLLVMFKNTEGNWVKSKISQLSEEEFSYFQTPAAKAHIYSTHMGMTTPSQFPLKALGNDNWKVFVNDTAISKPEYKLYNFEKDFVTAVPMAPAPNHPDYIENVSQVAFYTDDYPDLNKLKGDGWIRLDYLPGKKVFKSPSD